jgi:hypothetical protein
VQLIFIPDALQLPLEIAAETVNVGIAENPVADTM